MANTRKYNYEGMFEDTPFVFKEIDRKKKIIYFFDGNLLCKCSLNKFPPTTRGIKIAVNKSLAFSMEASKRHNNRYTYENVQYVNTQTSVLVTCTEHGDFPTTPHEHLTKRSGCPKCAKDASRISTQEIVDRSNKKHFNKYSYDLTTYSGCVKTSKMQIVCTTHGVFLQTPYNHYGIGQGCPECGKMTQGGKSKTDHVNSANKTDGKSYIYLIRCSSNDELFYKIDISVTGVKGRYNRSNMPYNWEVIHEACLIAEDVWEYEKHLLNLLKHHSYVPTQKFRGYSECFNLDQEVVKCFNNLVFNL